MSPRRPHYQAVLRPVRWRIVHRVCARCQRSFARFSLNMNYRRLGKSGLQLSELSFGAWVTFAQQISEQTAEELMTIAYESGVNFFDNAEAYANGRAEVVMGNVLKRKRW